MDDLLGRRFPVLSGGFVQVVDYMGNDAAICQAARKSYVLETGRIAENRHLIRYMMRKGHTSPFEQCELKLHLRVPMDVWRQWIRHRTASTNEYSQRYSNAIEEGQVTEPDAWRVQSENNRQGSEGVLPKGIGYKLSEEEVQFQKLAREVYDHRISHGVAREQARKDLPLSTYTEAYWKIDLHNLLHFLQLRMESSAQYEIRQYATLIANEIVAKWVPLTWEAFEDYRLKSLSFSQTEILVIQSIMQNLNKGMDDVVNLAYKVGLFKKGTNGQVEHTRESREFTEKLLRIGIPIPWEDPMAAGYSPVDDARDKPTVLSEIVPNEMRFNTC